VEYLADILVRLKAAARGEEFQEHPMSTFNFRLGDFEIACDFREYPPQIRNGEYNDPEWPRAIKDTARAISDNLLRYPVVAMRLRPLMVNLETLRLAAARWEEFSTYLAAHGFPAKQVGGEFVLTLDGVLACSDTLDLAASCIEEARALRKADAPVTPLGRLRVIVKRIWPPRRHKQEPTP
jgi:hypothetical protein